MLTDVVPEEAPPLSEIWSDGNVRASCGPVRAGAGRAGRAARDPAGRAGPRPGDRHRRGGASGRRASGQTSPRSTSPSRCSRRPRASAAEEGLTCRSSSATSSTSRTTMRRFDVLVSNFGVIFAPDHANVASELARVTRPGGRLGFTAWKPNPKLGELYRRFTEEPIEGREAYEWGREDHVEDMLGEDFELEFEDGTLWLEAESGEEIWRLFSESAPPVIALLAPPRPDEAGGVPPGVRRALRELPHRGWRGARAAPLPARARPAQMSEVVRLLQELIRLDTTNPPGNETLAAELLRDYLEARGRRVCALRAHAGAGEPRRAYPGQRRRPVARAALAHRCRARRPARVGARAVRRRPRRRRGLGAWRARHEGRGCCVCGRARDACARGLARVGRPDLHRRGRRGGGRRTSACSGLWRRIPRRCAPTSRSTRAQATASSSAARCCTSARPPRR